MTNLAVLTVLSGGGLRIVAGWHGILVGSSQAMG
jgi:hypothetical protein